MTCLLNQAARQHTRKPIARFCISPSSGDVPLESPPMLSLLLASKHTLLLRSFSFHCCVCVFSCVFLHFFFFCMFFLFFFSLVSWFLHRVCISLSALFVSLFFFFFGSHYRGAAQLRELRSHPLVHSQGAKQYTTLPCVMSVSITARLHVLRESHRVSGLRFLVQITDVPSKHICFGFSFSPFFPLVYTLAHAGMSTYTHANMFTQRHADIHFTASMPRDKKKDI